MTIQRVLEKNWMDSLPFTRWGIASLSYGAYMRFLSNQLVISIQHDLTVKDCTQRYTFPLHNRTDVEAQLKHECIQRAGEEKFLLSLEMLDLAMITGALAYSLFRGGSMRNNLKNAAIGAFDSVLCVGMLHCVNNYMNS